MMPRRSGWLICLLMTWWMLCPTQARCDPLPTPEAPGLTICLTELEWDVLQDQVKAELVRTAEEAVKAAVAPLLADLAGERARSSGWEREARAKAGEALIVEIIAVLLGILAAAGWGVAALK
jgi:hypothetical protein